jgi:hypothetical protein
VLPALAQEPAPSKHDKPAKKPEQTYYKQEEIIHDGKLYRVHNNYLSFGAGIIASSIRDEIQRTIGVDFQFPIQKAHFQVGVVMSGESYTSNNTLQAHLCYGLRKETTKTNLAAFIGPSFYTGVTEDAAGEALFYEGVGAYICFQAIAKVKYDVGLGLELFGEVNAAQSMIGIKVIAFFSGSYRGLKKNYNPNVRAENPR